ncbi:hypothetical protein [Sediminicoccus sp. BL-A-41-H5]|uniref:hypothetical protein n=1 Tax=Sediminicoccus sp. BL-A-41-H5 TaxID=3421106 RepID=UPI003D66666F
MSGARADRLAGWRATRAALNVATVADAAAVVATAGEPRKSAEVASVATVANENAGLGDDMAARVAFYVTASERALEALAAPDADLAAERAEIQAAREAEARGEYPIKPEAEHRAHLAALRLSGLQRPPAWSDVTWAPPPGAWCGCCGRHTPQSGGRWWREAKEPTGWRCWACHPPVHLATDNIHEVRT